MVRQLLKRLCNNKDILVFGAHQNLKEHQHQLKLHRRLNLHLHRLTHQRRSVRLCYFLISDRMVYGG